MVDDRTLSSLKPHTFMISQLCGSAVQQVRQLGSLLRVSAGNPSVGRAGSPLEALGENPGSPGLGADVRSLQLQD